MKLISLICPSCGAKLELQELGNRSKCFCQYCGQTILLDEEQITITGTVRVDGIDSESDILVSAESLLERGVFLVAQNKFKEYVSKCPDDYRGWLGLLKTRTRNYSVHDNNALFKLDVKKYYTNFMNSAPDSVIEEHEQEITEYFHPEIKSARLHAIEQQKLHEKMERMEEMSNRIKELKKKAKGNKKGLFSKLKK